jgi:hypothetical protein
MLGGFVTNPQTPEDQGLARAEPLFIDIEHDATPYVSDTTIMLGPGATFAIPANWPGRVSITAQSSFHQVSGVVIQPPNTLTPSSASFPPSGPTSLTQTIPSYLYQQYSDDDDLQAWVAAYNTLTQQYVDWFVQYNLAVYTADNISGSLLDWIGEGLYGIKRSALSTGHSRLVGPYNTFAYNTWQFNRLKLIPPSDYAMMSDDVYKRVMTWHLYKGDGKVFDLRWLKRRIERFLTGANGSAGQTDQTYDISVTFGTANQVNINLQPNRRRFVTGALYGVPLYNRVRFNEFDSQPSRVPLSPMAPIFKAAVDAGVLELPFQFSFVVNVN